MKPTAQPYKKKKKTKNNAENPLNKKETLCQSTIYPRTQKLNNIETKPI